MERDSTSHETAARAIKGVRRSFPVGAEIVERKGVHFRVWAPLCKTVDVVMENGTGTVPLEREAEGYFSGFASKAVAGDRYRFALDRGKNLYPDPVSRFQPEGPHGPSEIIDPATFRWTDREWPGAGMRGQVLYEMHVGTFTPPGTWKSAEQELQELAELGITIVEVMPVAEFPGRFGWGYDGVDLFSPTRLYGRPDDFRSFVNTAHRAGLGVILDVVYNHFGPEGFYLERFSTDYLTDRYTTEWGRPVNYDGRNSGPVREFIIANARYWIGEFHLDGLRIDATQMMHDDSEPHILAEIVEQARNEAGSKKILILAENEPQNARLLADAGRGGPGLDALWNDDFHHSVMVALTGHNEAYYKDYLGAPQELISAVKWGFLYQGQWYAWQNQNRGTPAFGIRPERFVTYIQNHDQIANSFRGQRCHELSSPGTYRAMTALLLLSPQTPMLFQGQEFCASSPFLYFADLDPRIMPLTREGRLRFLSQFPSMASPEMRCRVPDPSDPATFRSSKLDLAEREKNAASYRLHRDLLALRRNDPVFSGRDRTGLDGAVLGPGLFALRFFSRQNDDRLLVVNLGSDAALAPLPEPLLAPPEKCCWTVAWTSESPDYGGCGSRLTIGATLNAPGQAAVVLIPQEWKNETCEI